MQRTIVAEKLHQFVKEHCEGRSSLQLLLFLGRHPHARFSQLAITHALDARKTEIDRALRQLTNKGLVVAWTAESGLVLYSLIEDESVRGLIQELMALDWWQHQRMLDDF